MFDAIFNNDNGDNNESTESMSEEDMLQTAVVTTAMGHTLADYVLNDDETLTAFARFAEIGDENAVKLRENLVFAHDMFAGLAAKATEQLMLIRLKSMFSTS